PEWSRFVTIIKQQHKLDEVSYHKLFDILKQYQNEVNELRAEKLAKNANPLALVATAQADRDPHYQSLRSHSSSAPSPKPSISTRSYTATRHKGKEIDKPITPPSEAASEEDNDPEQAQRDKDIDIVKIIEIILNMSLENKAHYQSKKEAFYLLLTRIGDEIYSTVDACKTAHDIFTSQDGETMKSYYSRFYKMMNEMYQKDVNEIRAERIAKNANPLAFVTAAQQYQNHYYLAPKCHKSYAPPSKQSSFTRSLASTKYKSKEIAKPITPLFESVSKEDSDPEQAQRDKDMQKNLALIAKTVIVARARETVGRSQVVQQYGIQCFNCKEYGHFAKECRKSKRVKDSAYHKEKMLLCKQAEQGVPLQTEL
nr:Gag-Pol polyprotein [Tanacetum cinerariifolium]